MSANHEDRNDDRTPDVEVERQEVDELAGNRSTEPEEPARDRESSDHAHEEQIGGLLAAVVAALRGNRFRPERDAEEAAGIVAEVQEPAQRVAVPLHAGAHDEREAIRSNDNEAEQVEGEDGADDQVGNHRRFRSLVGGIAEVDVHAREEQREPGDRVHRVEDLVRRMEAQDAVIGGGRNIRHEQPPSWQAWSGNSSACEAVRASYGRRASPSYPCKRT